MISNRNSLPPVIERVFVSIDVMNIFHSGQEQFGRFCRVDYKKLFSLIKEKQICQFPRKLHGIAYTVTPHFKIQKDGSIKQTENKNRGFLKYLQDMDVEVKNRDTYIQKGINKPMATDWDVGITIDALNYIQEYDTFCLVSGDGDYSLLVNDLKEKGKFVEVITFEKSASRILCASAHRTILITRDLVFFKELNKDGRQSEE